MTHMCISSTARDAVPLGYSVIIPEDATATRDLDDGKGAWWITTRCSVQRWQASRMSLLKS